MLVMILIHYVLYQQTLITKEKECLLKNLIFFYVCLNADWQVYNQTM